MDQTPTKSRGRARAEATIEGKENPMNPPGNRLRKPPPVTPRRFNKFFTPRPRNAPQSVQTSRRALRAISSSVLNTRRHQIVEEQEEEDYLPANEHSHSRKKRKHSHISSLVSTPQSRSEIFIPSSQEQPQSSPLRREIHECEVELDIGTDDETDIDEDVWSHGAAIPRVQQYASTSTARNLLSTRLGTRRQLRVADNTNLWQHETENFYSRENDICSAFRRAGTAALPFSMSACNTNPVIATGDEEGWIRLHDTSEASRNVDGMSKVVLQMRPHDNALMDIAFSYDDKYIATACGDQTCQIIDVHTQQSLYTLRAHTASVKRVQFQPGSGDKMLASCGRDGLICLWDLRTKGASIGNRRSDRRHITEMAEGVSILQPVITIYNAHNVATSSKPGQPARVNAVPGRYDFSITCLNFLGESRNHYLATASEVETVIKIWDMRASYTTTRKLPTPVSTSAEPRSHEYHRRFGINSMALSTDGGRLYALSRDHTIYAYSTSHLILGSAQQPPLHKKSFKVTESSSGLGPLYGFRHPSLRLATFWPRLSIRKADYNAPELLAVGSSDECAVLFPTNEKYLTASAQKLAPLHNPANRNLSGAAPNVSTRRRPQLFRSTTSSFDSLFTNARMEESNLPIYHHGTPLKHGHSKEVTSLAFTSEGNLVTASDDYSIRCWREDQTEARELRGAAEQKDALGVYRRGWADVGIRSWDEEDVLIDA